MAASPISGGAWRWVAITAAQPKAAPRAKGEKKVRTDAHAKGAAKVKTPRKAGGE